MLVLALNVTTFSSASRDEICCGTDGAVCCPPGFVTSYFQTPAVITRGLRGRYHSPCWSLIKGLIPPPAAMPKGWRAGGVSVQNRCVTFSARGEIPESVPSD